MQPPGTQRGECHLVDDMEGTVARVEDADGLVPGAPTNYGNINALARRFLERCVGFAYWSWGRPAPTMCAEPHRRAVRVSASAAPAWMGRRGFGTGRALRQLARRLGAKPIGMRWVGKVNTPRAKLSAQARTRARRLGCRLVEA